MDDSSHTPGTLEQWRDFVTFERPSLEVLPRTALLSLSDDARELYNEQRFAAINATMVLATPQLMEITQQVAMLHAMSSGAQHTVRHGLALSGLQTLGKSTAAMYVGRTHEVSMRRRFARLGDDSFAPTVYITTPPSSNAKSLMTRFATMLGLPVRSRATTEDVTRQVVSVMHELGTTMVIIDEIQNLRTRAQTGQEAASALKGLAEQVPALFVYVGVDLPRSDFLSGPMGRQMRGRVTLHQISPYSVGSKAGRDKWERLIMMFEQEFPLADHDVGSVAAEAGWLYEATGGVIGSLRTLLRKAQVGAILEGKEHVDSKRLRSVELDWQAQSQAITRQQEVAGLANAKTRSRPKSGQR